MITHRNCESSVSWQGDVVRSGIEHADMQSRKFSSEVRHTGSLVSLGHSISIRLELHSVSIDVPLPDVDFEEGGVTWLLPPSSVWYGCSTFTSNSMPLDADFNELELKVSSSWVIGESLWATPATVLLARRRIRSGDVFAVLRKTLQKRKTKIRQGHHGWVDSLKPTSPGSTPGSVARFHTFLLWLWITTEKNSGESRLRLGLKICLGHRRSTSLSCKEQPTLVGDHGQAP